MRRLATVASLLVAATAGASPAARAEDGWAALAEARAGFEEASWTADFVQTWVPTGFSTGERESGTVSLALPGALRWDYSAPYAKSLLVRLDTAYSWNPGESSGRRVFLAPEERRHLALLELDLDALRASYDATLETAEDALVVDLTPRGEVGELRDARLTLDPLNHRLVGVSYADVEGNRTEFAFSGHRPAATTGLFAPPAGLDWLDD